MGLQSVRGGSGLHKRNYSSVIAAGETAKMGFIDL